MVLLVISALALVNDGRRRFVHARGAVERRIGESPPPDVLGDPLVRLVGVVEDAQLGEAFAGCITPHGPRCQVLLRMRNT